MGDPWTVQVLEPRSPEWGLEEASECSTLVEPAGQGREPHRRRGWGHVKWINTLCSWLILILRFALASVTRWRITTSSSWTTPETAEDAIRCAVTHRPDACLLAVDLPGNGVSAARRIKQRVPDTRILMMNELHRDEDLLACLRAGADGYLLKSTPAQRLPDAVLGMLAGEAVFTPAWPPASRGVPDGRQQRYLVSVPGGMVELTAREYEVLGHLRERRSTASVPRGWGSQRQP